VYLTRPAVPVNNVLQGMYAAVEELGHICVMFSHGTLGSLIM
jgi:hypothetical protein